MAPKAQSTKLPIQANVKNIENPKVETEENI